MHVCVYAWNCVCVCVSIVRICVCKHVLLIGFSYSKFLNMNLIQTLFVVSRGGETGYSHKQCRGHVDAGTHYRGWL